MSAFAMGLANRGNEMKVFDWIKAANLIKENPSAEIKAGLQSDWDMTSGTIWENGKMKNEDETYAYLASTWATPEIEINGVCQDCFVMESERPEWNAKTYFPTEAKEILGIN